MLRIAIIDDHAGTCEMLAEMLAGEGYEPLLLPSPGELVAQLVAIQPDLVLLDLLLGPWGDGLAVAAEMRREPFLARTPLILMTASPGLLALHAASLPALGCQVITKPFDLDALLNLIAATPLAAAPHSTAPYSAA